ncbi:hypothetical protein BTO32_11560 [Marinobacter lutaoensis]|uniref:DUF2924 domain-containing protein n=1 Tax=Marinobacter lutaoensis TaxID=135739 RepID=A0A1V2DRP6_9GAMM|nr:DUF2924 domain-containing protein [Marinobacter lutaoensis]ONF43312.1 hypothetical protein BTO32_11560 [Marinobacter lutaoensis]
MNDTTLTQTSPSVLAQVAQLPDMSMEEIRALWRQLFKQEAPTHIRSFLERRLAYRLQEIEFKRTPSHKNLVEQNQRRIRAIIKTGQKPLRDRYPKPVPGTVLTRIYQEKEYRVTVTHDNQFEFEGRLYRSLSVIAREITGTRWSGPLFFGLRKATDKKNNKRGGKR